MPDHSIDRNITDNIIKKVINGALKKCSIDLILLQRLPIQKHLALSITEKIRNKDRYRTEIAIEFVLKIRPWNIKCTVPENPDLLQALAILSDTTVRRFAVNQEHLKP